MQMKYNKCSKLFFVLCGRRNLIWPALYENGMKIDVDFSVKILTSVYDLEICLPTLEYACVRNFKIHGFISVLS